MGGGVEPLDPSAPPVPCERCAARQATALFRDDDAQPPVRQHLCADCAEIEAARKLIGILRQTVKGVPRASSIT